LPPGVFITSTPAAVDARAPDHAQLRRLLQNVRRHLDRTANDQSLGLPEMFRKFLRIGSDHLPAFLRLEDVDTCLSHPLGDQYGHYAVAFFVCAAS
jgi:hypothetical protein